jgi:hypothetical protein
LRAHSSAVRYDATLWRVAGQARRGPRAIHGGSDDEFILKTLMHVPHGTCRACISEQTSVTPPAVEMALGRLMKTIAIRRQVGRCARCERDVKVMFSLI